MEALQRLHNRGSISTGFDIDNSFKVENDNREYIRWTNFSNYASSARKKKFSMSLWCKRTELGRQQIIWSTSQNGYLGFDAGDTVVWYQQYGGSQLGIRTNRVFRDTSAWYHFMIVVDTAQSTEADRVKMYINGVQETSFGTPNTYPSQNAEASNLYEQHLILGEWGGGSTGFSGYIAEHYFLSEIAASPTDLGEYDDDTGIWKPKAYGGTITSPSHFLEFKDGSDLGTATSGLDGDTMNNLAAADQATDTPTNNFATINTLQGNSSKLIISNGATKIVKSGNHGWQTTTANIAVRKGKWYAEFKLDTSASLIMVGVNQIEDEGAWNGSHIGAYSNSTARGMGYYSSNGYFYRNGGSGAIAATYTAGDIIGIALLINDNLTGFMGMSKNGTWQNSQDPSSGSSGMLGLEYGNAIADGIHYTFAISTHQDAGGVLANFGGFDGFTVSSGNTDANGYGNFEYAVPTGYYALCTKNLEEFA
tara:strand:- start:1444 stop:2877 length:1434 start_codon:yes stop_codon:yes gene_type:complete